ncbi:MAG TPA: ribose 5-phosphate isomerase B [Phaeodactylibacter sp.]|nr:ribose 5-phosphate isomerase B [Phaeodactylibacter sp.]
MMKDKTIAIGGDHAGYEYKQSLMASLQKKGYNIIDKGPFSTDSVDYPDYVHPVAELVAQGEAVFGILICGSGNGVAMTANKHPEIRAAITWNQKLAALARQHNDANIICIPARFVSKRMAHLMVNTFLHTAFEGGRHKRRVDKIPCC